MKEILQRIHGPFPALVAAGMGGILWSHWSAAPALVYLPALVLAALGAGFAARPIWRSVALAVFVMAGFALLHAIRQVPYDLREFPAEVVELHATVINDPLVFSNDPGEPARVSFYARPLDWTRGTPHVRALQKISVSWLGPPPDYGQVVEIRGRLQPIAPPANPGTWNRRDSLALEGVTAEVRTRYAYDCRVLPENRGNPLVRLGLFLRGHAARVLTRGLDEQPHVTDVLQGLLLGIRDFEDPNLPRMFRETGTLHLFAVSGLHVGMWGLVFGFLLRFVLGLGARKTVWLLIPILLLYALVTGFRPPIVRATVMAVIVLAGIAGMRRPQLLNSIAAAAFLLLVFDPNQLFQPGFQFSFVVVLSIVLLTPLLMQLVQPWLAGDPLEPQLDKPWHRRAIERSGAWFAGICCASVAAFFGSLLLGLWHFHLWSPWSTLVNIVAIQLAFSIVAVGILTLLSAVTGPWLPMLLNGFNAVLVNILLGFIGIFWALPASHIYYAPGRSAPPAGEVRLTLFSLNFSQSAILIETTRQRWLVDTGGSGGFDYILRPGLNSLGINRLDGLVLTHGDSSHIGAATQVWEVFDPQTVWLPANSGRSQALRTFRDELAKVDPAPGTQIVEFTAETTADLGDGVTLTVLYPPLDALERRADDRAAVFLLQTPQIRILLMGDAGFSTEQWLITNHPELTAHTLIYNEHADDLFGLPRFIGQIRPSTLILTATRQPVFLQENLSRGASETAIPEILRTHEPEASLTLETSGTSIRVHPASPNK